MDTNQLLQPVVLLAASGAFAISFVLGVARLRAEAAADDTGAISLADRPCRPGMKCFAAFMVGLGLALALLGWRFVTEGGIKFNNHLDVFLLLGLMLAGLLGYFRATRHLLGLALFLVPMIALVMAMGGVLSLVDMQHTYDYHKPLVVIHVFTIVAGSACFAAGCAGGAVYLLADHQLRQRGATATHRWIGLPSLASMEKFTQRAVLLGFPLLTLAIITGFVRAFQAEEAAGGGGGGANRWALLSKVSLSILAWIVYTPLVHIRLMPAFRGRRAAWLSIIGFGLLLCIFVASVWMAPGK